MSVIAIVLISLFAGAALAALIAATTYLAWMQRQLKLTVKAAEQAITDSTGACTRQLELIRDQIGMILEAHHQQMVAVVGKINGEQLAKAAEVGITAARRIETCAVAIGELTSALLSEESLTLHRIKDTGLEPESYAPEAAPGERYVSLNRTAQADARELERDNQDGGGDIP
jgi:hypothetical protein